MHLLSGGNVLPTIIAYLTKTISTNDKLEHTCNSNFTEITGKLPQEKKAMAVTITHFTASDMMELNVVMVESFRDLIHFIESVYKMLSLTMFPHSKIPSPHKADHAKPLQCSGR